MTGLDDRMRPPAEIVLEALLVGQEVEHEGFLYRVEDGRLLWRHRGSRRAQMGDDGVMVVDEEPPWFGCDLTLTGFLRLCEGFSRDTLVALGANTVLTQINRRGGTER